MIILQYDDFLCETDTDIENTSINKISDSSEVFIGETGHQFHRWP